MGKQRMTVLDIRAVVSELRTRLAGLRLANVYDVSPRLYLLKFSRPGVKELLLVESGVRIHTTKFSRDKSAIPSGFSMKLRKHIRTRRLESIDQLGSDRVVDMTFGMGETKHHLICELYDKGNVVLTDGDYTILTLLRAHKHDSTVPITMVVGQRYTAEASGIRQSIRRLDLPALRATLGEGAASGDVSVKQHLSANTDVGPVLVEHCLLTAALPGKTPCSRALEPELAEALQQLAVALENSCSLLEQMAAGPQDTGGSKGYIVLKPQSGAVAERQGDAGDTVADREFDDVVPILLAQHQARETQVLSSFDGEFSLLWLLSCVFVATDVGCTDCRGPGPVLFPTRCQAIYRLDRQID